MYCYQSISWPTISEWRQMLNVEKKNIIFRRCNRSNILWNIETKHRSQELNYSGYIHFHAIHAQIIVESLGKIRYIEYGFSGHQNDQNHPLSKGVRFTCQWNLSKPLSNRNSFYCTANRLRKTIGYTKMQQNYIITEINCRNCRKINRKTESLYI